MPWSGTASSCSLTALTAAPAAGPAGERVVEVDAGEVQAHREHVVNQPTVRDRSAPGDHVLLAAVALEVDQRSAGCRSPRSRAPPGQRERQRGQQPVVDAAAERVRHAWSAVPSVTSADSSTVTVSTVAATSTAGSSGREPSSGSRSGERAAPLFEFVAARGRRPRPRRGACAQRRTEVPPARPASGSLTGVEPAPRRSPGPAPGSARRHRRPRGGGPPAAAGRGRRRRVEPHDLQHRRRPPGSSRSAAASSSARTSCGEVVGARSAVDLDATDELGRLAPRRRAGTSVPVRRRRRRLSRARSTSCRSSTACDVAAEPSAASRPTGRVSSTAWENRRARRRRLGSQRTIGGQRQPRRPRRRAARRAPSRRAPPTARDRRQRRRRSCARTRRGR